MIRSNLKSSRDPPRKFFYANFRRCSSGKTKHISSKAFFSKRFSCASHNPNTFFCEARKFLPGRKPCPLAKCTYRLSCTPANIPFRLRCNFARPSRPLSQNDISYFAQDFSKARPSLSFCRTALRTIFSPALRCRILSPNKIPILERTPRARKCFLCSKIPCKKDFCLFSC